MNPVEKAQALQQRAAQRSAERHKAEQEKKREALKKLEAVSPMHVKYIKRSTETFGKPEAVRLEVGGEMIYDTIGGSPGAWATPFQRQAWQPANECQACRYWTADTIGDGTGTGDCSKGDTRLHWPGQIGCKFYATKAESYPLAYRY